MFDQSVVSFESIIRLLCEAGKIAVPSAEGIAMLRAGIEKAGRETDIGFRKFLDVVSKIDAASFDTTMGRVITSYGKGPHGDQHIRDFDHTIVDVDGEPRRDLLFLFSALTEALPQEALK